MPHQGPEGHPPPRRRETSHRGPRRARLAGPAVRLGRRTPHETRAPSVGSSRISRSEQAKTRSLFADAVFTSHPVVRREPGPPRQRAGRSLRAISSSPVLRELPRASPCRRERCVSPTSATDANYEHPARCPIPDRAHLRAPEPLDAAAFQCGADPSPANPAGLAPFRASRETIG